MTQTAWSPDGCWLATASKTPGEVHLWSPEGKLHTSLDQDDRQIEHLCWSPDSKLLATCDWRSGVVALWNPESGKLLRQLVAPEAKPWRLAWSPDGKWLAAAPGSRDRILRLWRPDGTAGPQLDCGDGARLAWTDDGRCVITARGCSVAVWDAVSGRRLQLAKIHDERLTDMVFCQSSGQVFTCSAEDRTVRCYEATTGKCLSTLVFIDPQRAVTIDAQGRLLTNAPQIEKELVYYVEQADGSTMLHSPDEFRKLYPTLSRPHRQANQSPANATGPCRRSGGAG